MKALLSLVVFFALALVAPAQDWEVWPTGATNLATGEFYSSATGGPLKLAVLHSAPGDVVEVHGHVPGVSLALGENYRKHEVVREVPIDVTIVGTPGATMGSIAWAAKGGGVAQLTLVDIVVDGRNSQSPIAGFFKSTYGDLSFIRVELLSSKTKTKWGSRIMGQANSITVIGCVFVGGGIEHPWYFDNPADFLWFEGNVSQGWGRTGGQIVTREYPVKGDPWKNPGAATGNLTILNNRSIDNGWEGGNGGSAFTVAGWPLGTVRIDGNYATSPWDNGAVVVWGDKSKLGELALPGGYAFSRVVIRENVGVFPNGARANVAVQWAKLLEIRIGEQRALLLDSPNRGFDWKLNGGPCERIEIHSRVDPNDWSVFAARPFTEHTANVDPAIYWTTNPALDDDE